MTGAAGISEAERRVLMALSETVAINITEMLNATGFRDAVPVEETARMVERMEKNGMLTIERRGVRLLFARTPAGTRALEGG